MIVSVCSIVSNESVYKRNLWRFFWKWDVNGCLNLTFMYEILKLSITSD